MSAFEPIPLAIGFSGHRDISPDDEEKLRTALKERLKKLQTANKPTPLRAFSGLAEGADMIFVEAALDCEIEVIAVMPVEVDEFVKDFEEPAHRGRNKAALLQRFETLRQKVADIHVVPVPEGTPPERVRSYGPERDAQYTAVGAFIVRQSAILIALWDGVATDKPGGTSNVVRFKRDGVPPQPGEIEYFPAPPDGGPVMQLGTTRVDSMGDAKPTWHDDSFPEPQDAFVEEFDKALRKLQQFNDDAIRFVRSDPDQVARSRRDLLDPEIELDAKVARAVETYAVADALAIHLQKRALRVFKSIAILAIAMVVAFELYGHLAEFPSTRVLITGYVGVFVIAYVVYRSERRWALYTRFLDYRCLAEGLRVQIFWHLAGLTEVVADQYLHHVRGELRWIRDALRSLMVGMPEASPRLDIVLRSWILDQGDFFAGAAKREETSESSASQRANRLFLAGFAIACALAVLELVLGRTVALRDSYLVVAALLVIAFVTAGAAGLKGYSIKRAYAEHAKQYGRMARVFSLARKRLASIEDRTLNDRTRGVLLQLGREALAENAEWILLHRERQIEPPI